MNQLKYKDYIGSIDYAEDDNCLYGKVLGIKKSLITYEGNTIQELREDFIAGVEHYLSSCREKGVTPEKSYSGSFNVRLTPDLHAKIAEKATNAGISLNAFIRETLQKAVL